MFLVCDSVLHYGNIKVYLFQEQQRLNIYCPNGRHPGFPGQLCFSLNFIRSQIHCKYMLPD